MSKKNLKEPYNSLEYEYKHNVSLEYYLICFGVVSVS